jgi:uncharacterized protein YdhG (YjbR/CyaY superfamily)
METIRRRPEGDRRKLHENLTRIQYQMQSKAASVDEYLKEVPAERLEAMKKLRALFLKELKGYKESMQYGGPCYSRNNVIEAGFASQKHFIGVYILKTDVMKKYKGELKGVSTGKGCIRFTNPEKIDYGVVQKMLRGTSESINSVCD